MSSAAAARGRRNRRRGRGQRRGVREFPHLIATPLQPPQVLQQLVSERWVRSGWAVADDNKRFSLKTIWGNTVAAASGGRASIFIFALRIWGPQRLSPSDQQAPSVRVDICLRPGVPVDAQAYPFYRAIDLGMIGSTRARVGVDLGELWRITPACVADDWLLLEWVGEVPSAVSPPAVDALVRLSYAPEVAQLSLSQLTI